jgi:LacI family transcriptional regulator
MASLKDVARRAGVSVSTVSHVINGYDDISESTRRKVLQAIRELNYHPNSIARNLLLQRSHTVGVVTVGQQSISHPLFNQLIVALAATVEEADLGIALTVYDPEADSVDGCLQRWHEQRLEGIVVIGMAEESPLVQAVARSKIPAVFVDTQASGPKATWIASDNRQGAYEAVTHLLRLGHRKIAFLQGVPNGRIIRDRYEGYKQALQDAGLPADDTLYEQADFTKEGAYRAAERLFARTVPTAIFCVSDLMAFGVMQWARDKGIAVPDGLAVVGFDDDPASEHVTPALTTVRQSGYEMGLAAARSLLQLIEENTPADPITLPTRLVVRASCGAPGRARTESRQASA